MEGGGYLGDIQYGGACLRVTGLGGRTIVVRAVIHNVALADSG
jgi:hypothetical protein